MKLSALLAGFGAVGLCVGSGCMTGAEWDRFLRGAGSEQPESQPRMMSSSKAVRDTIAPLVTIQGLRSNQVRGFGLVVDLVDTGGRDGPEVVKKHLRKEMRRRDTGGSSSSYPMLNSRDSTMVELTGYIPAGARKGDRFDVVVQAMGSDATSLVGGRLVLGELKVFASTPSGVLSGKTLAIAEGPVFVSPFDRVGRPTDKVDLRRGVVLGGGIVREPRRLRLILNEPSPSRASRIERRLNGRYGGGEPVVEGTTSGMLELKIPPEFDNRRRFFLDRAVRTTTNGDPAFLERRKNDLLAEWKEPEADGDAVGLAMEAIGPIVVPDLRRLYDDASAEVSFFAARTGVRLTDREALTVMARIAGDADSPFRKQAIDTLGWAVKMYAAGEELRKLLSDSDNDIRIEAYKALRRRRHAAIQTKVLDQDGLILDVVDSFGPFLIYIQRERMPRIAVFGRSVACRPPAMFPGDRDDGRRVVTQLSARPGDKALTFKYKNKRNNRISPSLSAPLEIVELIEFLGDAPRKTEDGERVGYAVCYSEIIDILSAFVRTKSLSAELVVEDLTGGLSTTPTNEREESEF